MEHYVGSLISQYRRRGVLVDTNLLLLLYIGGYDRRQVELFKRTADRFVSVDFDTLTSVLDQFDTVVTTPHILTEVSNLMGQLSGRVRDGCFDLLARSISNLREHRTAGAALAGDDAFIRLGITDTSILEAAIENYLVLTDDFTLFNYLGGRGLDVLNFNNIRTLNF